MNHIDCTQNENIENIQSKLKTQKQLGEETFSKVMEVETSLNEHRKFQQIHEKELVLFMAQTNKVMRIVNEQLLPVYDRDQRNTIADEVIKERAGTWQFWAKFISAIAAVIVIFGWVARQMLKS